MLSEVNELQVCSVGRENGVALEKNVVWYDAEESLCSRHHQQQTPPVPCRPKHLCVNGKHLIRGHQYGHLGHCACDVITACETGTKAVNELGGRELQ